MHSPFEMLAYDTMKLDGARVAPNAAPVRTTLRSLLRRLGEATPPAADAPRHDFDLVLDAPRPEPVEPASAEPDDDAEAPALATPFETRVQMLRANAHAAYRCVQGPPEAALDAALTVIEAEWRTARLHALRHAEALKRIRLYSLDDESRRQAWDALETPDRGPATAAPVRGLPIERECTGRGRGHG